MNFLGCVFASVPLVMLLQGGCFQTTPGTAGEEKEPHYLAGKSRVNAMDFKGAIESFGRALEANPRSSLAHFELGWLFDQRQPDPAAAIYHYESYLRLNPKALNSEVIRQRILACKQELARTVSLGPVTEKQQRDLEKMGEDNKRLQEENRLLNEEVAKWRAYFASQGGAATAASVSKGTAGPPTNAVPLRSLVSNAAASAANPQAARASAPVGRSHTVKPRETLASIARQYQVPVAKLQAANPGIDPRKLRPGKVLNIP